jgi:DNA-binding FadR family transcriptional regulator
MARDRGVQLSGFLKFLSECEMSDCDRLPSLVELSRQLGISIASLREQLEVARVLGLVDVRPKTGIRRLPYSFRPALQQSVSYAITVDPSSFKKYADLRKHIEESYWLQAVSSLNAEDHDYLRKLVRMAKEKLKGSPVQVPHWEHRELHLSIYHRLENPFVTGILETYWELYEAVGLDLFTDYNYVTQVWQYHEKMVEYICAGDYNSGYHDLREHIDLINDRPKNTLKQKFE